ncbi:poly [adp-ribose] polymerase [Anaeramoeba flamelloides]|uniref:Poly [ADP-ribose] polymerase n=1 Tax=Anaeramoeba flamelloides TaxID=1746091 RepID=A0AAV7Z2Q4_9EUKA|nr:poly [adp-ribose] polymerase [Anaeramoeba flamelloides]
MSVFKGLNFILSSKGRHLKNVIQSNSGNVSVMLSNKVNYFIISETVFDSYLIKRINKSKDYKDLKIRNKLWVQDSVKKSKLVQGKKYEIQIPKPEEKKESRKRKKPIGKQKDNQQSKQKQKPKDKKKKTEKEKKKKKKKDKKKETKKKKDKKKETKKKKEKEKERKKKKDKKKQNKKKETKTSKKKEKEKKKNKRKEKKTQKNNTNISKALQVLNINKDPNKHIVSPFCSYNLSGNLLKRHQVPLSVLLEIPKEKLFNQLQVIQLSRTNYLSFSYSGTVDGLVQKSEQFFFNKHDAIDHFEQEFLTKTGKNWHSRKKSSKKAKKYIVTTNVLSSGSESSFTSTGEDSSEESVTESDKKTKKEKKKKNKTSSGSSMDTGTESEEESESESEEDSEEEIDEDVQDLIKKLFRTKTLLSSLIGTGLDLSEVNPFELKKAKLKSVRKNLQEIEKIVCEKTKKTKTNSLKKNTFTNTLETLSSQFYSELPHDFGFRSNPIISSPKILKKSIRMVQILQNLFQIQKPIQIQHSEEKSSKKIKLQSQALGYTITPITNRTKNYQMIARYLKNSYSHQLLSSFSTSNGTLQSATTTHSADPVKIPTQFKILDIFELSNKDTKKVEKQSQKYGGNSQSHLLLQGATYPQVASILTNGFSLPPNSDPKLTYPFGKGIYFTNSVSQAIQDCNVSRYEPHCFLLLTQVFLGKKCKKIIPDFLESTPKQFDSVWAQGRFTPDEQQEQSLLSGIKIPNGKIIPSINLNSQQNFDQFILFNIKRIQLKFLVSVDFEWN